MPCVGTCTFIRVTSPDFPARVDRRSVCVSPPPSERRERVSSNRCSPRRATLPHVSIVAHRSAGGLDRGTGLNTGDRLEFTWMNPISSSLSRVKGRGSWLHFRVEHIPRARPSNASFELSVKDSEGQTQCWHRASPPLLPGLASHRKVGRGQPRPRRSCRSKRDPFLTATGKHRAASR